MKKTLLGGTIALALLGLLLLPTSALADENIYGLRIENINKNGADFYWITSVETKGSVEYAYTKLAEMYNPQSPGPSVSVLITAVPLQVNYEDHYVKEHHIRIDNLDLTYDPFVQYTVKSQTFNGDIYTISGEFVLVDTDSIHWWQTWQFVVFFSIGLAIAMVFLGKSEWMRKMIRKHHTNGSTT